MEYYDEYGIIMHPDGMTKVDLSCFSVTDTLHTMHHRYVICGDINTVINEANLWLNKLEITQNTRNIIESVIIDHFLRYRG